MNDTGYFLSFPLHSLHFSLPDGVVMQNSYSMMSRPAILQALERGEIIIEPFNEEQLNTVSYDVTLGEHLYRESDKYSAITRRNIQSFQDGQALMFNPYSETGVRSCWISDQAVQAITVFSGYCRYSYVHRGVPDGIKDDDLIILLQPQELILAHTIEFIGTNTPDISLGIQHTTEMHSRSTSVRSFIDVCGSGGFGDLGYCNRWTMEIRNNSRFHRVPLIVGRRYAQISFFQTAPLPPGEAYGGKYQQSVDVDRLKAEWHSEMMLPRMYMDRR
jgi:deoxycytidine triphosphate deaminase